jgi:hypothetical protein
MEGTGIAMTFFTFDYLLLLFAVYIYDPLNCCMKKRWDCLGMGARGIDYNMFSQSNASLQSCLQAIRLWEVPA